MSWTGHIFVIFGVADPRTNKSSLEAFGFYPTDKSGINAINSTMRDVPGSIEDNLHGIHEGTWTPDKTQMLVVEVPALDF